MDNNLKSFQQKVKNRKFAIGNSWKATGYKQNDEKASAQINPDEQNHQLWVALEENLFEADLNKFNNNGHFPIISQAKYFNRFIVFIKRVIRKLLDIFLGWYLFPIYHRQNQFNGRIINAASLERELILKLENRITELENANIQLKKALSESVKKEEEVNRQNRIDIDYATSTLTNLSVQFASEKKSVDAAFCTVDESLKQLDEKLVHEADDRNNKLEQLNEMVSDLDAKLLCETGIRNEMLACQASSINELRNKVGKIENLPTSDDDFYHHFEERFRGSREDIKNRLQVYVPVVKEHLQDWSQARFVDIGSGRGEWLDILSENGASEYVGVDLNEKQNAIAESYGHKTVCQDCIDYLAAQEDESIDLISGIQVIEHLCMSDLMELLRQSHRVLKKGGMILFETQNPRNIVVGADTFYIDPSHKRVLDPGMVTFFAEWSGFDSVRIIDANAYPQWVSLPLPDPEDQHYELVKQFNDVKWLLYGPMDYALFAVKE